MAGNSILDRIFFFGPNFMGQIFFADNKILGQTFFRVKNVFWIKTASNVVMQLV